MALEEVTWIHFFFLLWLNKSYGKKVITGISNLCENTIGLPVSGTESHDSMEVSHRQQVQGNSESLEGEHPNPSMLQVSQLPVQAITNFKFYQENLISQKF